MERVEFYSKLKETLELEDKNIDDSTPLHLTSIRTLALIVFIDENFGKQVKITALREVKFVSDLIKIIGEEAIF